MEQEIERLLRTKWGASPDAYRKNMAVNSLVAEFERHPVMTQIPLYRKLTVQAGYISPLTWVMQLGLFLLGAWMIKDTGSGDFPALIGFAAVAPLFGLIGCTEIARSFFHGMWEMEDACRFPLRYVMSMRMFVLGAADLAVFIVLLAMNSAEGGTVLIAAAFLLVPFHLANTVYLAILMGTGGKCPVQALAAAGIFMALGFSRFAGNFSGIIREMTSSWQLPGSTGCVGWIVVSFMVMLGVGAMFIKGDSWEAKRVWN